MKPWSVTLDDGRTVTVSAEITYSGGVLQIQDAVLRYLGEVDRERVASLLRIAASVLEGRRK